MTIRPIDMQVMMPKVQEVSKTQQVQNQSDQTAQQQFSSEFKKQTDRQMTKIKDSENSQGKIVRDQEEKNKQKKGSRQKKHNDEHSDDEENKEQQPKTKHPKVGRVLDIKV